MQDCIQAPELNQFIEGKLPESRAEEISSHIDDCEACQDTVVAMSGTEDTFVEDLKAADVGNAGDMEPREPAFRHGLQRLLRGMSKATLATADSMTPQTIGPYIIEEKLGDGGMGTVFKAQHTKLKRNVALKVLPSHRWSNAKAIARFEREMEAIGQLDHPHIVRASDAGEDQGMHYLVMDYVDGLDLSRLAKRLGPLPVADACELARQAAIGLQHAHDSGLVHRDVKPSNLMLAWERSGTLSTESKPALKILDLGLALLGDEHLREEHDVTTVGALMGTLDYMSPEQGIDSHSVDHRADIYGLGATLFKLLAGRAPYADPQYSTLMKKMTALATKAAPSLGKVRPDLPASVVQVVDKMLARDPDERFASAREVAEALVEPAKQGNLGTLLSKGIATEDPVASEGADTFVRLNRAAPSLAPQTALQKGQGGGWKRWLAAAVAGFLLIAAGLVYRISTDYGDVVIESDDPNVEVVLKQNEKIVESIQLKQTDGRTRIRAGKYEIEVNGASEITTYPKELLVERGGQTLLPIREKEVLVADAKQPQRSLFKQKVLEYMSPSPSRLSRFRQLGIAEREGAERQADARLDVYYSGSMARGARERVVVKLTNTGTKDLTNVRVKFLGDEVLSAINGTPGFWRDNGPPASFEWLIERIPPDSFQPIDVEIEAKSNSSNDKANGHIIVSSDQGRLEKTIEVDLDGQIDLFGANGKFDATDPVKTNYKVQPGDILGIFIPGILGKEQDSPPVYEDKTGARPPALGYPIPVREDGLISIPYTSNQKVDGLTIPEIEAQLRKALTEDKKVLREEATILVSVIRKANEVEIEPQTRLTRSPRYDGRNLSEWLEDVQYERNNDRLVNAVKAVVELVHHPDNEPLVDQSISEILKLMRQYGDYSAASTSRDELLERSWLALTELEPSKVADHIISEIENGNSRSRRFLLFLWEPVYERVNEYPLQAMEAEKKIRKALAERGEDFAKSLLVASESNVDLALEILFEQLVQAECEWNESMTQVCQRGLAAKQKRSVAMSVYMLAKNDSKIPGLAKHAKAISVDPDEKEPVNPMFDDRYSRATASAYLSLVAIEEIGPNANALDEVAGFLGQTEFESWNRVSHYHPKLPGWEQNWNAGGGGMMVPATKKCNFRPTILRILASYGEEAKQVLPSLLSSFARSPQTLSSLKGQLVKLDPSLAEPVLEVTTEKEAKGDAEGTLYNVFGEQVQSDDTPPIQYVSRLTDDSLNDKAFAMVLARLLTPVQDRIGQRLGIEYQVRVGDSDDKNYFEISSFGNRQIYIVLPDPSVRGGNFLAQCNKRIHAELDAKWNDLRSSETLTINLKPLAKKFDAEQANKTPYMQGGGMMGGGMGGFGGGMGGMGGGGMGGFGGGMGAGGMF